MLGFFVPTDCESDCGSWLSTFSLIHDEDILGSSGFPFLQLLTLRVWKHVFCCNSYFLFCFFSCGSFLPSVSSVLDRCQPYIYCFTRFTRESLVLKILNHLPSTYGWFVPCTDTSCQEWSFRNIIVVRTTRLHTKKKQDWKTTFSLLVYA